VCPAKTAESIKMLIGLRTWVGPKNPVLDGIQIPMGMGNFEGRMEGPIVKYKDTLQ